MLQYIFVLVLLCTFSVTTVLSQQKLSYYTTTKVGDTATPYISNKPQILIFADENSCFTCMVSANTLTKKYAKQGIECVMFIQAGKQKLTEIMNDSAYKHITIIDDKIGAYKKLYAIKNKDILMFLNKDAVVKFIGVLGKVGFNTQLLDKEIQKELNATSTSHSNKSQITLLSKTMLLKKDGSCVGATFARYMAYLTELNYFALLLDNNNIYFYDTSGTFSHSFNIARQNPTLKVFTPTICGEGFYKGRNVLFINDNTFEDAAPIMYMVDFATDSITKYYQREVTVDSLYSIACINTVPLNFKEPVFVTKRLKHNVKSNIQDADSAQFLFLNQQAEVTGKFGIKDPFYKAHNLRPYNWILFGKDSIDNIYAVYSLGRNLFKYTKGGELISSTPIFYDSTLWSYSWIENAKNYTQDTPVEEYMELQKKVTMGSGYSLLMDKTTGTINIPLIKLIIGAQNNKELRFAVHQIYPNGKQKTVALPMDTQPFYIDNNIVWCVGGENNCFYFYKYKINE